MKITAETKENLVKILIIACGENNKAKPNNSTIAPAIHTFLESFFCGIKQAILTFIVRF